MRDTTRVVFGTGTAGELAREVEALGAARVLVVTSRGRQEEAERISAPLGSRRAGILPIAWEHVPEEIAAEGVREAERRAADAVLAVGGGSSIGLAKAIALGAPARVMAVPTTYSGSEMTDIYGTTCGGVKRTGRDERVRPVLVIYDPALTLGLPREVTVTSLFNAMAHAVEALWAKAAAPQVLDEAEHGLRLCAAALPRLIEDPRDLTAREEALEGAYLSGSALSLAGTALHHKLCHVLGGLGLPHAATHAVLLPHVVRFHRSAAPEAMRRIARALGCDDPALGLADLARSAGVPPDLESLGLAEADLDGAVDRLLARPFANPRPLDRAALRALLEGAFRS